MIRHSPHPELTLVTVTLSFDNLFYRTYQSISEHLNSIQWIIVTPEICPFKKIIESENCVVLTDQKKGVYEAMNVAKSTIVGRCVLYLNAGDEAYLTHSFCKSPATGLLPVKIVYPDHVKWVSSPFFLTRSYVHQGLVLPADHTPYNTQYRISADFDLLMKTTGISGQIFNSGFIIFHKGGLSDQNKKVRDQEILCILREKSEIKYWMFLVVTFLKDIFRHDG